MLYARKYRSFSVGFLNVPCGCNRCFAFSQRTPSRCYQSCFIIRFADCAKHKRPGSFKLRVFRRDTYVSHTLQDRFIDSKDQIFEIGEVSDASLAPVCYVSWVKPILGRGGAAGSGGGLRMCMSS